MSNQDSTHGGQAISPKADSEFLARLQRRLPEASIGGLFTGDHTEVIEIKINGQKVDTILSTGTTISYCTPAIVQKLNLHEYKVDGLKINGRCGNTFNFSGYCDVTLEMEQIFVDVKMLVSSDSTMLIDMVLGKDVLLEIGKKYDYGFSFGEKHYQFGPFMFPKVKKPLNFNS